MTDRTAADEAAADRLPLGAFALDLARGELLGADGRPAPLRRQALEVLLVLGRQVNQVVTKDELMAAVWPGVVVGDGSLAAAVADIRRVLGDAEHRRVRNIARRGYMLVVDAAGAPMSAARPRHTLAALFVVLALLAGGGLLWVADRGAVRTVATAALSRDVPMVSIVVLPLAVDGSAGEVGWFADALLGDLIVETARIYDSVVIGRDTALTYQGREVDPRTVARELGVRWVVRGRVRYADDRVRLTVELIDGETGAQRWSDTLDTERAQLQRLLDDYANRLARLLQIEIYASNAARSMKLTPTEVQADDLAMQGMALWFRGLTRDNVLQAIDRFERAVVLDPRSLQGWAGVNYATLHASLNGWLPDRAAAQRRVAEASERIEQIDPDSHNGYMARVIRAFSKRDWPQMLALCEPWMQRHRLAHTYGSCGAALVFNDRPDDAVIALERALRMSPREPFRAEWQYRLALAHYIAGRYEPARDWGLTAHRTNAGLNWPPIHAAALVELGDRIAAQRAFDEFAAQHPKMDAAALIARLPGTTPRYVAARERLMDALRELGLQ
jgi:TolB-like protein/DNA-binding winged helix-turn-helix (wHTH) protein